MADLQNKLLFFHQILILPQYAPMQGMRTNIAAV